MTIELFVFPPSPNAFKVLAVANHLGVDYALRWLDLRKGEQKSPEYAALNPNMKMPTLKEGDFVLWESNAIMQYLASKRPEMGLLPKDERARFDVTSLGRVAACQKRLPATFGAISSSCGQKRVEKNPVRKCLVACRRSTQVGAKPMD